MRKEGEMLKNKNFKEGTKKKKKFFQVNSNFAVWRLQVRTLFFTFSPE